MSLNSTEAGTGAQNLKLLSDVGNPYRQGFTTETSESSENVNVPRNHCYQPKNSTLIQDVWEENFEEEFWKVMELAEKYNVVGMDTEFPGIVYKPDENDLSHFGDPNFMNYKTIKMNVDNLKIIQIGISLADEQGYLPEGVATWQFNFRFDVNTDTIGEDSIGMLISAGIKFDEHARRGIDHRTFAEYLVASGLVLNEDIRWVCFHGGFDFGYLLKMISGEKLPEDEGDFIKLLMTYFPNFYDVKTMIGSVDNLKNMGLSKLASDLQIKRIGTPHQGGSDSLLTLSTYFKLKELYFKNTPDSKFTNMLHGLKSTPDEYLNPNLWYNYLMSDYPYMMMNNNVHVMGSYFPRTDSPFNQNYNNTGYNMGYNMGYNNYPQGNFGMDSNQRSRRKE